MADGLRDGRRDLPIFVHSEIDDLEISSKAFRVYAHLTRRAGSNGACFPSYQSIGDSCFQKEYAKPETRKTLAIRAVKELVELRLVNKEVRMGPNGNKSNDYTLTDKSEWFDWNRSQKQLKDRESVLSVKSEGVTPHHPRGDGESPKGTPIEGTHYSLKEGSPKKSRSKTKGSGSFSDSDQEQNSDQDQYGHKRKTRNSEKPGTSGLRNRTAIAQKDFSESKESVPVPEPVETTTPSQAVLDRDTVLPRFLPKKKTKGEIEYGEDSNGWLQLPRGSRYARERKIACRMMQESLVDRYEYTDWVEEDGVWFIENTKDGEILPVEEALSSSKGLSLRALRNYLVTHSGLSQEAFNDDLQEAFESAIALCEKWGDRVFDLFSEWVVWRECAEDELGLEIFQRSLSCW
jgi:hypothetical protein